MEKINFRAVERSTQDVSVTINNGNSERWTIQSQKTKYVNGKMSGVIGVGYTASINNSDYLLEEDKSNNEIQITALTYGTSGTCVFTQNESGNRINLKITTPEERETWELRFNPIVDFPIVGGVDISAAFTVATNISGEGGLMSKDPLYRSWIVNQDRHLIKIYIDSVYPDLDMLSWSCLDKDGNAFSPNYDIPDNQYFTTRTIGLGSYAIKKISTPPSVSSDTPVLSSRFRPTKKYPLDLNFYWGFPT